MLESTLWGHLKPELKKVGKFQKISDRFTPGVPDVIGCMDGVPWAIELKTLKGVKLHRVGFRPGQLDWLQDWVQSGGVGLIMVSQGQSVWVFEHQHGKPLEEGVSTAFLNHHSLTQFTKIPRVGWSTLIEQMRRTINEAR